MPTDPLAPHLSDDLLNEYLDTALSPAAAVAVEAHLASCRHCAARLEALRALFAELGALPEAALTRDLAPAVVAALPRPALPAARGRPWLAWVLGAQALGTALGLALAWPFLAGWANRLGLVAAAPLYRETLTAAANGLTALNPARWLAGGRAAAEAVLADWQTAWPLNSGGAPLPLMLAAAALTGLIWIVTNWWLLQHRLHSPRRS